MKINFFTSAVEFRLWLDANHHNTTELLVGFYKLDSGRGGITYAEALDEALCYGWIDGVRKRVDEVSYTIRFTPRKPRSIWSKVNLGHVARLQKSGRMMPAGLKAFEARTAARSGIYAFENAPRSLAPADERAFKANKKAWKNFKQQAPYYQRVAIWWVISAKKEETRARRLKQLIEDTENGRRLKQLIAKK
jgi:uncharacterized protein YdeI (YjbR/CyaY-like superfamily)